MLVRGTITRSGTQIVEEADRLGGSIDAYGDSDYAEIAATLEVAVGSVGVLVARAERAFRAAYLPGEGDFRGRGGADYTSG